MSGLCCMARFAAAAVLALAASGCGTVGLFGAYDLPESEAVANAPWPRLVDTPAPPPPGTYSEAVPDPAEGVTAQVDLGAAAASAAARAADLAAPVIDEAERDRLLARARRTR